MDARIDRQPEKYMHPAPFQMPWLHVKLNYFEITSALVNIRLELF